MIHVCKSTLQTSTHCRVSSISVLFVDYGLDLDVLLNSDFFFTWYPDCLSPDLNSVYENLSMSRILDLLLPLKKCLHLCCLIRDLLMSILIFSRFFRLPQTCWLLDCLDSFGSRSECEGMVLSMLCSYYSTIHYSSCSHDFRVLFSWYNSFSKTTKPELASVFLLNDNFS